MLFQWLCRFVATRVLVFALALTRYLQMAIRSKVATSLYGSPLECPAKPWWWLW